jgi:hypothetical protein
VCVRRYFDHIEKGISHVMLPHVLLLGTTVTRLRRGGEGDFLVMEGKEGYGLDLLFPREVYIIQ